MPVPEQIDDTEALRAALPAERAMGAEARATGAEAMIAHLKLVIAKLRHDKLSASSERGRKLIDQLELGELIAAVSYWLRSQKSATQRARAPANERKHSILMNGLCNA